MMDILFVFIGVLLACIGNTVVTALQCPSCTYFVADKSMHGAVRNIAGEIFDRFKDESCSKISEQSLKIINVEECLKIPDQIARCSYMVGLVTLTVPLTLLRDVDVKLQVYHRGCYYSATADVPPLGCSQRRSNNLEASFINHVVNKEITSSEPYKVSEFNGQMCICSDQYCSNMSSTSNESVTFSFPYRHIFYILVIHWLLKHININVL